MIKKNNVAMLGCLLVCSNAIANPPGGPEISPDQNTSPEEYVDQGAQSFGQALVSFGKAMISFGTSFRSDNNGLGRWTTADVNELRKFRDETIKPVCDRHTYSQMYIALQEMLNEATRILAKRESRIGSQKTPDALKVEANRVLSLCNLSKDIVSLSHRLELDSKQYDTLHAQCQAYWKTEKDKYDKAKQRLSGN